MSSRTLRLALVASTAVLALVAALSCSTSSNTPPDVVGPGPGGGSPNGSPSIELVSPEETCATAGNTVVIFGANLVGDSFLTEVTINGVRADVISRFNGTPDELTVETRQQAGSIPSNGLLVDVRVTNSFGAYTLTGGLRLLPGCIGAPVVVTASPSSGSRLGQDAVTLSGDNLACVTSVQWVGTQGGGALPADIVAVVSDQSIIVKSPTTNNPSNQPYEIVVTSACGTNSTPRPTWTYTGSGGPGSVVIPDATSIFDVSTGLSQGPSLGGNTVRITGRDLDLATSITIGGVTLAVNVDFIVTAFGDILITAMPASPAGSSLTVPFNVIVSDGTNADPTPVVYTYLGAGAPTCATLAPNSGSIAGGTQVTITGTGLNDITQVLFGGVPATSISRPDASGTRIVVAAPPYPAAIDVDVALQIAQSGGTFTTVDTCSPARFTYVDTTTAQFTVTAIAPESGPQTGGTTVTITGTGLTNVNSVRICNVVATITQVLDEQILATTGAFGGVTPTTCDVVVSTSTGLQATLTAAFTYNPVVPDAQTYDASSATTSPACGGTTFRLNGVNFIGGQRVRFGGSQTGTEPIACDVQFQSNTQVSGTAPSYQTPAGPFPADVNVVVESAAGGDTTPLTFRYYANPSLISARSAGGGGAVSAGDVVVLTGSNFRPENDVFVGAVELCPSPVSGACTGAVSVQFAVIDNNTIQFVFPNLPTVGLYDITIRTLNGGRSCTGNCSFTLGRAITYGQNPSAARVSPSIGPYTGGTTVTITGNFPLPISDVTICGVIQTIVPASQTASQIQITTRSVPEATAGAPCDVTVNSALGSDTVPGAFTFVADPDPSTVEVNSANCGVVNTRPLPVAAGQTVTIRGTDLLGVTSVKVGTAAATINEATRTDASLDITIPAAPAAGGPVFDIITDVAFTSPVSTFTDTVAAAVRYQAAPTITSLTPPSTAAGQLLTIAGTALANVNGLPTTVEFDGNPAVILTTAETSLTVVVPAGIPGDTVALVVSTCQGDAVVAFTYPCNVPSITGIAPTTGSGGTSVTITGSNLLGFGGALPTVTFGATTAQPDPAGVQTNNSVVFLAPPGTLGQLVDVKLTNCGGTSTSPVQFQYQCVTPTITSVTPSFGVAGATVTITGINLDNPSGGTPIVRFGATVGGGVVTNGTTLTVTAPAGAGTVNVSVQTCGGTATQVNAFSYCPNPTVTSLSPGSGPEGSLVTIIGSNLQAPDGTPATVIFGGTTPGVVQSSTPIQISVQAPAGLSGIVTVTVQTCGGQAVNAGQFRFCTAPTITTIAPLFGTPGVTQIVINGTNLLSQDGNPTIVRVGGIVATIVQQTATRFTVTAPAAVTGSVSVTLTTCGGTAVAPQLFAACVTPVISGLVPNNGPAGTEVTISGTDLVGADGVRGVVQFQGTTVPVIAVGAGGSLIVDAPTGFSNNQAVSVRVTTCGGTSAPVTYTYQTSTTCVAPTVTGINPTSGAAGSQMTITGTNLIGNNGSPATVTIGGTAATLIAATPTSLVVTIPAGAGVVAVTVTTCGGSATSPQTFRYCVLPTVTSLVPASGPAGSTVLVNGTFLVGADGVAGTVTFGTTPATVVDATATRLTVTAPVGIAPGTVVNVRVTTCGGTSATGVLFTYISSTTFDVTGITPITGPRSGGQLISIAGTGLTGVNSITICGVPVSALTVVSDTQVTATTGVFNGSVPSACDVIVTKGAQTDTLPAAYTYTSGLPDGVSYATTFGSAISAPGAGGVFVRIAGTTLLGVTKLNFGGRVNDPDACNVQAPTDTYVTGIAPAYVTPSVPAGGVIVDVFAESSAGVDPTPVPGFTYYPNPTMSSASPSIVSAGVVVTVTGSFFKNPSIAIPDVFIEGTVRVRNAGFSHPETYPEDEFDAQVAITSINSTGTIFTFTMPATPKGDTYKITITVPNAGLSCVDDYTFTLFALQVRSETNCADALDVGGTGNDGDGFVDCADGDCEAVAPCP